MDVPVSELCKHLLPSKEPILRDQGSDGGFDDCAICLSCSENDIVSLSCDHRFHKKCIEKWMKMSHEWGPTCPNCRLNIIREDDMFWIKLGRETSNLKRWAWYCYDIMQHNFGTSSKYTKNLDFMDIFIQIQGKLDRFLLDSYTFGEDYTFEKSLMKYLETNKPVRITDVFYNTGNFDKPPYSQMNPIPLEGKRYRKTLTSEQIDFINHFKDRMSEYIVYLKFIKENIKRPTAWDRINYPYGVPQSIDQNVAWEYKLMEFHKNIEKLEKKTTKIDLSQLPQFQKLDTA
jgi:hypothetical protein